MPCLLLCFLNAKENIVFIFWVRVLGGSRLGGAGWPGFARRSRCAPGLADLQGE